MRFLFFPYLPFVFLIAFANPSFAGSETYQRCCCPQPLPPLNKQHHWYADLGIGWTFNTNDYDGHVNLINNPADRYLTNGNNDNILLALSGGYNWFFQKNWIPAASLGVEYSYLPKQTINGQIQQLSNPMFVNYNFSYKTQHNSLSLLGKLNIYRWNKIMPFVIAGVGSSWNDTSSYQEQALPGTNPRISPNFTNNWDTSWKYTLGVGLDYQPKLNFLISLFYRYDDFRNGDSGPATGLSDTGLKIDKKAYANTVMLSARYLFA